MMYGENNTQSTFEGKTWLEIMRNRFGRGVRLFLFCPLNPHDLIVNSLLSLLHIAL